MNEEPIPDPEPDQQGNAGSKVLWLVIAFFPSLVGMFVVGGRITGQMVFPGLLFLTAACCLCSGIGIVGHMKDPVVRVIAGLVLAVVLFFLNAIVVIFIGCSQMRF